MKLVYFDVRKLEQKVYNCLNFLFGIEFIIFRIEKLWVWKNEIPVLLRTMGNTFNMAINPCPKGFSDYVSDINTLQKNIRNSYSEDSSSSEGDNAAKIDSCTPRKVQISCSQCSSDYLKKTIPIDCLLTVSILVKSYKTGSSNDYLSFYIRFGV